MSKNRKLFVAAIFGFRDYFAFVHKNYQFGEVLSLGKRYFRYKRKDDKHMAIINSIVNWLNFKRIYEIDLFKKHPIDTQREVLFELLDQARDTEFGEQYNFRGITTEAEFKKRIPIRSYEDFSPYIDRLLKGEKNILWPGETKWFAKSSGTTNDKSKFIPVSKHSLEDVHYRGFKDVLALYLKNNPESGVLLGKSLTLGGSHRVNSFNNNSFYGDLSAILIENTPFWSDFIRTPPADVALIEEFDEKVAKIIEQSRDENVTSLAGVPSWNLVLLNRVLEATGKKNILDVWPNLEVFIHGGIKFDPYREQYRQIIPSDDMRYMETYNASEGFFAIQDNPETTDLLLMLDYGIYYEFIPMDRFHEENPPALSLEEVELEKNYAMVISTNGGLWRYLIGDTVKFTRRNPFKIKITGRTKHYINAFGEELIIDNAEEALKVACNRTQATILEYTAGPVFMGENQKGAHQWIIEFDQKPDDLEHFISVLDGTLKTLNSDYEAKRHKNITLERPHITLAPEGLFYEWMKQRGKIGGQNKIPRLANDRIYLDQLLELQKNKFDN
ncbi:GH3 auxin-responsive promoter family protein [Mangrovibacterium lignilyticum]|uniref:GH3 auxin-responsive promoter family protein n=1 Tax=Mangrovibacterium lignilyticum TaxID=2668052 RepID=UPI001EE4F0CF|nr:GH3 auxin-responsive promoter family protein [Mangrovibacterium lignilyticum]